MAAAMARPPSTRVAVVTGGNKGIGLEVCRQLASNGITVVLTARDERRGAAAVEELREAAGLSDVVFHQLEVTDAQSIARLAGFLEARFGKVDILVNNAAIGGVELLPVEGPDDGSAPSGEKFSGMDARQMAEWMWTRCRPTSDAARAGVETNYYGTKNVTEALLPLLQASPDGRVVNVSSDFGLLSNFSNEELKRELNDVERLTEERLDEVLGVFLGDLEAGALGARGWPTEFSAYKVAKAAVNAYSRVLARRHPELRVNCAHPGYVKTDLTRHSGLLTPAEGASNVVKVAMLPQGGPTGVFFALGEEAPFVVAVVTGGNKGIGLEVCRQLASSGVVVILTARDERRGSEAVETLHGLRLPDVQFHRLDVSDPTGAARLAEFIKEKFGRLDILINNAGVIGASATADIDITTIQEELVGKSAIERLQWLLQRSTESYEEAEECLKINYFGTKYVTQALLPLLLSSSDGRLINVSSNYGLLRYFSGEDLKRELNDIDNLTVERLDEMSELFLKDYKNGQLKSHGWPADSEYLAYKVSKALINGYTRILANTHPKLRINSVHPGYCKTDINFDTGEYTAEEGASCIVSVALLPEGGPTGVFFFCREESPFV
ncbi:hypothetical protein U9M48_033279 [Paspalum notatum var. saurae]|uniref:(+)-neomenthol dehydrogenase n=1 Tax=Paspalum notatum var. saurae TaxID=547442 RepID=A0AAQ3X5V3_PASNO